MKKLAIASFSFLLLALFVFLGWRSFLFVRENLMTKMPTCLQMTIANREKPMIDADVIIVDTLSGASIDQLVGSKSANRSAGNDNVYVFWDYPSHKLDASKSRIRICQWNRESGAWQKIALLFEKNLSKLYSIEEVNIDRDPGFYRCNANCRVKVELPLNFDEMNKTVLKRDRQ